MGSCLQELWIPFHLIFSAVQGVSHARYEHLKELEHLVLMVVGCYVIDYCAGSLCSPSTITFSFTIYVTYENR